MINKRHCNRILLAFFSMLLFVIPAPIGVSADPGAPPSLIAQAGGVRLTWHGATTALRALDASAPAQSLVTIGGVRLPAELVALRVEGDAPLAPQINLLTSTPWQANLPAAEVQIPQTVDGDLRPALAAAASAQSPPTSPVVVLREGRMRGVRIAVLALSPVFAQGGTTRAVTALEATIPGTALLDQSSTELLARSGPFLAAAPGPSNPAASGAAWTVRVTQTGIQRLPNATLATAGVSLADPTLLHLRHGGVEVALEQHGAEFRFYASPPGDRWNAADTYWLTVEATPGVRMATRSALPGAASAGIARDRGEWRGNALYDSTLAGPHGDHWFAADMKTAPDPDPANPAPPVTLTAPLTQTLTPAAGSTLLTLNGSAYTSGQHNLSVSLGGEVHSASWSGTGDWSQSFTFAANNPSAIITLLKGSVIDGVEPDSVAWDRPIALNVAGNGAIFAGAAGTFQYKISDAASDRTLYDVSNATSPSLLTIPVGSTTTFEDGPSHQYVLAGVGTLFTPSVSAHQGYDLSTPGNVVYITPTAFQSALAPLVARRQAQGYSVRVIDVQALYDGWSFGQVNPSAIRDFLRYAAANWSTPPVAVTLVGDGTSDPLNHLRRDNLNIIPPYLATVDPWLKETACEICYARLDGVDPTLDALPDLALGRLTVENVDDLAGVVKKIVAYETSRLDVSWRSRNLYIADNFREPDGKADGAGNFAAFADTSAAQQPAGMQIQRVYYDPSPSAVGVSWREPDAVRAHEKALAALNQGAGLVNYIGHGSQFQLATTDIEKTPPWLVGLYDTDALTNGPRLPIVLEMTCLTSAFQTPAFSKTTIDERLLIKPDGGAVAIWGPTGLGVTYGHDALQRGFYDALWSAPPLSATVGQLTTAGYFELFTNEGCCQETLSTYALLGDPLTPARVLPASRVFAPLMRR